MYRKLDLTELNALFNTPPPKPTPKPISPGNQQRMEKYITALTDSNLGYSSPSSYSSSPASSSSTLALDEDEISSVFRAEKLFPTDNLARHVRRIEASLMTPPERLVRVEHAPQSTRQPLNPFAVPFVPPSINEDTPDFPDYPTWYPAFWRGAQAASTSNNPSHAINLAGCGWWSVGDIATLAQHFCWKGSDMQNAGLAPFARILYLQLKSMHGEEIADSFLWHLRECAVGSLNAFWDSGSPESVINNPSPSGISAAICLAAFIGDLFAHGLIPGQKTHHCLYLLVCNLMSIEHIQATHALISLATRELWTDDCVRLDQEGATAESVKREFVGLFTERMKLLRMNASLIGTSVSEQDLLRLQEEILDMVVGS